MRNGSIEHACHSCLPGRSFVGLPKSRCWRSRSCAGPQEWGLAVARAIKHYQGSIPEWAEATSSASCPAVVVFHRLPAAGANERGVAVVAQRDPTGRVSVRSCEAVGDREYGRATKWAEDDSNAWLESGDAVAAALEDLGRERAERGMSRCTCARSHEAR